MLRRWARRPRQSRSARRSGLRPGQILYVALLATVPVSAMILTVANTGQAIQDRTRAQDTADAAALAHAAWAARSLNIMAQNNVTLTQLNVTGELADALNFALDELKLYAGSTVGWYTVKSLANCPKLTLAPAIAACFADHVRAAFPAAQALDYAIRADSRLKPGQTADLAASGMRALDAMNTEIVNRFPDAVAEIATRIAEENGVEAIYFHKPCTRTSGCGGGGGDVKGMDLPVQSTRTAANKGAYCGGLQFGSGALTSVSGGLATGVRTTYAERGFPNGQGPLEGGGDQQNPHLIDHINEESGIGRALSRFDDVYRGGGFAETTLVSGAPPDQLPFLPLFEQERSGSRNAIGAMSGYNLFTARATVKMYVLLCPGKVGGGLSLGSFGGFLGYGLAMPEPTYWDTVSGPDGFGGAVQEGLAGISARPGTIQELEPDYKVVAFVAREPTRRLGSQLLAQPIEFNYAYGQAVTYNADLPDLYSQNWRGALMPASRLDTDKRNEAPSFDGEADTIETVARLMAQRAPAAFDALAEALQAASANAEWDRLNAH